MNAITNGTLPASLSADSKRNAYTIHCDAVQHAKAYCVCISLCARRKEGRLPAQYADCSAAIGKKECIALKMRKEEIVEGRAIYFTERMVATPSSAEQWSDAINSGQVINMADVRPKSAPISKPAPVSSKSSGGVLGKIDDTGYAKAISRAIEKESMPKVVPPPPKVEVVQGESLLEMARRLMGGKTNV